MPVYSYTFTGVDIDTTVDPTTSASLGPANDLCATGYGNIVIVDEGVTRTIPVGPGTEIGGLSMTQIVGAGTTAPGAIVRWGQGTTSMPVAPDALGTAAASGAAAPARSDAIAGVDANGRARTVAVDYYGRGQPAAAAADFLGHLRAEALMPIQVGYAAYTADPDRFATVVAGGGAVAYVAGTGEYSLSTPAATPASAILIHNYIGHYRLDHELSVTLTGNVGNAAPAAGQRLEWGATSGVASGLATADAVGFCVDASAAGTGPLCIFYRSAIAGGPSVTVRQSAWNVDRLDGSGGALNPSGYSMTSAQAQNINYYKVEIVWLGAWGIRWSVNGYVVHQVYFFASGTTLSNPFARNPHLRLYVWINNASLAAANSFDYNCGVLETAGGGEPTITPYAAQRATITVASGASAPLIGIRSLVTLGGIPNGKRVIPKNLGVFGSQSGRLSVYYGLLTDFTVTGAVWAAPANASGSSVEIDVSSTAVTVGAGAFLVGGYMTNSQSEVFDLTQFFDEITRNVGIRGDGLQTAVYVMITNTAAGSGTYTLGGLNWHEEG